MSKRKLKKISLAEKFGNYDYRELAKMKTFYRECDKRFLELAKK